MDIFVTIKTVISFLKTIFPKQHCSFEGVNFIPMRAYRRLSFKYALVAICAASRMSLSYNEITFA